MQTKEEKRESNRISAKKYRDKNKVSLKIKIESKTKETPLSKPCIKCGIDKPLEDFYKSSSSKIGRYSQCICCHKEIGVKYRETHKEELVIYNKNYREIHKEERKIKDKIYIDSHKEEKKIRDKIYRDAHKEEIAIYNKNYRETHKEEAKAASKIYRENHKEEINEYNRLYREENPLFNLSCLIRNSIRGSIKSLLKSIGITEYSKPSKTEEILGCTIPFFLTYIESKFNIHMNWKNYGKYNGKLDFGWDLDHIIPSASAKTIKEVLKLNHYTNFQPLCSYVNRVIKRDRLDYKG